MSRSDSLKSTLIFVAPANSQEAGDMDGAEDGERSVHFASGGAVYSNPGGAGGEGLVSLLACFAVVDLGTMAVGNCMAQELTINSVFFQRGVM